MDFDQFRGRGLDVFDAGELDAGDGDGDGDALGSVDGGSTLERDAGSSVDASSMNEQDAGHDAGKACVPAEPFDTDTSYKPNDRAEVGSGVVYRCKAAAESGWCSLPTYEPGAGSNWRMAWEFDCAEVAQGCGATPFVPHADYTGGTLVQAGCVVYRCDDTSLCSEDGHEPGAGEWESAWSVVCAGC